MEFIESRKNFNKIKNTKLKKSMEVAMISKTDIEDQDLQNLLYSIEMLYPKLLPKHQLQVIMGLAKLRRSLTDQHFNNFVESMFLNNNFLKLLTDEKINLLKVLISMKKIDSNHVGNLFK
jgi:hypothetical protein